MRKLVLMLMFALGASLTSCSCFDSAPVEPKILGVTHVIEDRGLIYVEIDSMRYPISDVFTGKTNSWIDGFETVEAKDGMLVTVADFTGNGGYTGIRFMLGEWNENQIELAFHRNYSVSMIGSSLFLLLVIVATFTFLYVEDNKHTKALQALQADENADKS